MTEICKAELVILVDSNGDYAFGKDEAGAREAYENEVGALNECDGFRLVKVAVNVPLPAIVEMTGQAEAQADGVLTVG